MSYEIVYDRRFIRTTRGIIPMILSGSSNCTEIKWASNGHTYERLERHWWSWTPSPLPVKDLPESAYLDAIGQICQDADTDYELCKWNGHWLRRRQWRSWFRNGINNAYTLEEYLKENREQSFAGYVTVWATKDARPEQELFTWLHTTKEVEEWIDNAHKRVQQLRQELGTQCQTSISLEFSINEVLHIPVKIDGSVIVKVGGNYVKSYTTGWSQAYTTNPAEAHVFSSVEEARKELGADKWGPTFRYVKAAPLLKPRNFILKVNHGRLAGRYISRKTKNRLWPCVNPELAMHFASQKDAIRFAEKTAARYAIGNTISVINVAEDTTEEVPITKEAV